MKLYEGKSDKLRVKVFDTRDEMGEDAAKDCAKLIRRMLILKKELNIIFAAAPSQNEFLASLIKQDIDFTKINAFHMDEYIGLAADAPQGFANFLRRGLFNLVPFKSVNCIDITAPDAQAECARYASLLESHKPDIVCMGIGENGHIAFNDPGTGMADFNDPLAVKRVVLDDICRQQQVNDGCFASIDEVPLYAITLTIPTLMSAPHIFCVVPGSTKEKAVTMTVQGIISENCPASVLRRHRDATMYCDRKSGIAMRDAAAYD